MMNLAHLKTCLAALSAATLLSACHLSAQDKAVRRVIAIDGGFRTYRIYAPKSRLPKPALVIVLHGWKGSAGEIERRTKFGFDRLAEQDGFVVVYPDAVSGQWHSGHPGEVATSDDVGFLSDLIDLLSKAYNVDPKRIFVTGLSNGASMSYRLACERPDRIAALAPVSGGLAQQIMPSCAAISHRPIPLFAIHGTNDPVVPFDSGELEGNLAYWVRRNGCKTTASLTQLSDADPTDGTRTRVETYADCAEGADVVLYAIEGGGHHWPGGDEPLRLQPRGRVARDFDGATVIWNFMKRHPKP